MKLTLEGLKNKQDWEAAGIKLPSYDCLLYTSDAADEL